MAKNRTKHRCNHQFKHFHSIIKQIGTDFIYKLTIFVVRLAVFGLYSSFDAEYISHVGSVAGQNNLAPVRNSATGRNGGRGGYFGIGIDPSFYFFRTRIRPDIQLFCVINANFNIFAYNYCVSKKYSYPIYSMSRK